MIALITGASSGFGRHFAFVLARSCNATVILCARRVDRLKEVEEALKAEGHAALSVELDVTQQSSVLRAFETAAAWLGPGRGPINVVINNAGVARPGPFLTTPVEDFDGLMATNSRGAFLVAQEAARRMAEAGGGGRIINIGSILGIRPGRQQTNYSMAKSALHMMTRVMAVELAKHKISVNCIAPGYFATEMNDEFFATAKGRSYIRERVPFQRLGRLEELDGILKLLAGDGASFITGAIIPVDGGHVNSAL